MWFWVPAEPRFCLFWSTADWVMYYSSKRRGEDGISAIIDFLLSNARLVLGVGGVAVLGIATLAVKKVRRGRCWGCGS